MVILSWLAKKNQNLKLKPKLNVKKEDKSILLLASMYFNVVIDNLNLQIKVS